MSDLKDGILSIIDRLVTVWLSYRAGQSAIINKCQEKLINELKTRDTIEYRNDSTGFDDLMRNNKAK
jgi:hypothetical protein